MVYALIYLLIALVCFFLIRSPERQEEDDGQVSAIMAILWLPLLLLAIVLSAIIIVLDGWRAARDWRR